MALQLDVLASNLFFFLVINMIQTYKYLLLYFLNNSGLPIVQTLKQFCQVVDRSF